MIKIIKRTLKFIFCLFLRILEIGLGPDLPRTRRTTPMSTTDQLLSLMLISNAIDSLER